MFVDSSSSELAVAVSSCMSHAADRPLGSCGGSLFTPRWLHIASPRRTFPHHSRLPQQKHQIESSSTWTRLRKLLSAVRCAGCRASHRHRNRPSWTTFSSRVGALYSIRSTCSALTTRTVTERARKLRAQYALQAQGLRARLELRVNRIPQALRKRNIQELIDEHHAKSRPAPPPSPPIAVKAQPKQVVQPAPIQTKPSTKRKRCV